MDLCAGEVRAEDVLEGVDALNTLSFRASRLYLNTRTSAAPKLPPPYITRSSTSNLTRRALFPVALCI